jgi:hypothetical protein
MHQLVVFLKILILPALLALWNEHSNHGNLLSILTKHPGVLVTIIVVLEGNLGIVKKGSSKNQGMLAIIENE